MSPHLTQQRKVVQRVRTLAQGDKLVAKVRPNPELSALNSDSEKESNFGLEKDLGHSRSLKRPGILVIEHLSSTCCVQSTLLGT